MYDCEKPIFASRSITDGRVNASARKIKSGCACFRAARHHSQKANDFVCGLSTRKTVTPLFPEGLTVYSTYGQYQNPTTKKITREPSKDLFVDGVDTANLRSRVTKVADAWKKQFNQQSVGIVTSTECMVF